MERLIELFINTEDGEFYDRGGLLAAYDPAINAGELVRLTVQLCAGVPAFNSAGALLNPDTTFAGTLAAAETIIDNNFNWYDKGTLLENLTTGTAISELSVASEAAPRQLGAVRLNAGTVVNFCGWTATEGGYRLTLADNEFNPAQFTPAADFAQGAAVEVLEQPIIVSAQNDDSGRDTGLFSGLLDAANPVYESMIEGQEDIPNCRIEFSIYQDGRAVFRARRYFDCLGAMAMNKGAAYVHSDSWREADSRYIKLVDWQAPQEYQFSEDGTNWHDQQQDADLYYHERRPGGQWGQAVKMKTGPTGAAAGFGTPSVTVETLPAGSDATASVTASGDNTAKVFSFNFGIPKGADGQNGTNGADGAAGADGVSSYTYVAYASDASGGGFSLTPSNALKFRAEIHTTTAIETPDAEDFAGATWVKYIGDDGTGAGDMTKTVYDTDDDGIVDHAATADAVGATTAAQVADAVGKAHTHANKATLDKFGEANGKPTFDGAEIGGGSGTVKSVNGQLPDESGNVTVETGGVVDESRLLPVLDTLPEGYEGSLLAVQRGDGKVADENTLRLMHFNDDVRDVVTDETGTLKGNASITPTGYFSGALSINSNVISSLIFNGLSATPNVWTMDFRVKLAAFSGDAPQILCGTNLNETQTSLIRVDSSYIDIQATYNQRVIYKTHSLQLNTWYHFALTYDGTTYKFYIDGTLFGTGESTKQFDFTRKLWFGSFYDYSTSYVSNCTIDEFRLSDVVRWTENFTPPDAPYGESLYNWGIGPKLDESRLLPENPANGDIPCFDATATVGGGNDANTKLLIQPETGNNQILDQAAGNAAPVDITNSGNVVIEDNALVFTGTNSLLIPANALGMTLGGNNEFMIDIEFQLDSVKSDYATLYGSDGGGDGYQGALYFTSGGAAHFTMSLGPDTTGWTLGTKHRITIERWNDNGTWKTSVYRNGSFLASSTSGMNTLSDYVFPIGSNNESTSRNFIGKIWAFRISNKAIHKGQSFTPDELPWTKPQTVGEWGKLNKSELVQSVNGQTPDSSGAVTLQEATASAAGLMAAADKAAIAGLTTRGIYPNALEKSGAVDFNEVIDHGFYFIGGDTPHLNYPETYQQTGGTLQVIRNGNYLTQTLILLDKNKSFNRSCFNAISGSSERKFSAWQRLLTDTEITESKVRPGYFKLPGGTIVQWGAATIMNDGLYQVTFPIAFPNAIFIGNATAVSGTASASGVVISILEPQTNRMTLITKNHPGNDKDINVHWLAIGY